MVCDLSFEAGHAAILKRLDGVCSEILRSPKLNEENRTKAINQAAVYYITLNEIVSVAGGQFPDGSKPIVESVIDFIKTVESFCIASEPSFPAS